MSKLQTVTLLRDHEHDGRQYRASETIEVTEPVRQWLLSQHLIATPIPVETNTRKGDNA